MSWGTSPIDRFAFSERSGSLPMTRTVPALTPICPHMARDSVDFPAPLGPSSATISPRSIARLTSLRTCLAP
jgi:hypothetical protein